MSNFRKFTARSDWLQLTGCNNNNQTKTHTHTHTKNKSTHLHEYTSLSKHPNSMLVVNSNKAYIVILMLINDTHTRNAHITKTNNMRLTILSLWSMWNYKQKDPSRTWCESKWLAWWSKDINWKRKKHTTPKATTTTTFWRKGESEWRKTPNRNLILLRQDHLNQFQFKWISMHVRSNDECKILWSSMWCAYVVFIYYICSIHLNVHSIPHFTW